MEWSNVKRVEGYSARRLKEEVIYGKRKSKFGCVG
jgi:hypothetical protein